MERSRCVFLILSVLATLAHAKVLHYNETGLHTVDTYASTVKFVLPSHTRVEVNVLLTFPKDGLGAVPLILAFNGFQCQAAWYQNTTKYLASWGYATMQYDMDALSALTIGEREEVKYLDHLLAWLAGQVANSSSPVYGKIDLNRKALLGHSRGGKLATLHYARRDDITTAVLFDPVDCGVNGHTHPSAVAAMGAGADVACGKALPPLTRSNKSAAVIGAGVVNWIKPCNPPNTNFESILSVLAEDSWRVFIKEAGHMQFASSNNLGYWGIDFYCRKGKITTANVLALSNTIAVAWLESAFRKDEADTAERLVAFRQWRDDLQQSGVFTFGASSGGSNAGGQTREEL